VATIDPHRHYPPVADYALLSDCHSAALVSRDGSIDWCCFHRVDASPVFARLLDRKVGGYFQIAPRDPFTVTRRYLPDTNIIETRFETRDGVMLLIDFFALQEDSTRHPLHQLLRIVRCQGGTVRVGFEFMPRFDYGRTIPRYEPLDDDLGIVYGGADALVLQSQIPIVQKGVCSARGDAAIHDGDQVFLALTYSLPHELNPQRRSVEDVEEALETTCRFWTEWSARCTYEGPYREQVVRSALVLKALTNTPTGAIVAAPTTSLPEEIGGSRNWDYRYAWLRDAALNLYALFALGYTDEAHAFMSWVERTTAGRAQDLQILYGVGGERFLPEIELGELDGYEGSSPVRIGNAAVDQFQLDVYGYLLDTAWLFHRHGGEITESFWSLLRGIVDVVADRWVHPDDGIWEVRGGPRHFVSSKVFAWVAVDRAIRLAQATGLPADIASWRALRKEIKTIVLSQGINQSTGAFVRSFGERAMDASALLIPLVRFLPADDQRVLDTMKQIEKELAPDGLVYRYLDRDDGLPGGEATFVICSFWLVDNLALAGQHDDARELFERLLAYRNDVGLLSEEVDPNTGELLGNFPQAFSHVGLIGAALNLARAEQRDLKEQTAT
jgi:GH15 family glucan-1,4-alpha-glucosidase